MTIQQAREKGFTHIGTTYGFIKIYGKDIDTYEPDITGVNWFWNLLLEIVSEIDVKFELSDGFNMDFVSLDDIIAI